MKGGVVYFDIIIWRGKDYFYPFNIFKIVFRTNKKQKRLINPNHALSFQRVDFQQLKFQLKHLKEQELRLLGFCSNIYETDYWILCSPDFEVEGF